MSVPTNLDRSRFDRLLQLAREEDFGEHGDLTTALLPAPAQTARGRWSLSARQAGRFCGHEILPALLASLAPEVRVEPGSLIPDGTELQCDTIVARLAGRVAQMLAAERVLLNFLQRLSGVATLTHRFVATVAGLHVKIFDTRKTTPGWRDLERYAVRVGGGHNHRRGLFDAILIKDNHLAGVPVSRLSHTVFEMLNALDRQAVRPDFVEVEADSLEQVPELLNVVGIDVLLLDNFAPSALREAVRLRDAAGLRGKMELEASGGINLDNVRAVAEAGVERIAVGALTHSAPALDLGLDALE